MAAAPIAPPRSRGYSRTSTCASNSDAREFPSRSGARKPRLPRPLGVLLVQVAVLLDEHLVERQALGRDLAALRRLDDLASRLGEVRAIVELAGAEEGAELAHRFADLVLGEVEEAERLEAGRVDDRGVAIEPVEARE